MVKRGKASGGKEVRRSRMDRSVDMLDQTGSSRDAGSRPAIGGMGICEGMSSREARNGSDDGYAAGDTGESNDLMRSGKEICS